MAAQPMRTSTLDDLTDDSIDAQYVERRLDDWNRRLKSLYADVRDWLAPELSAKAGAKVRVHEELMRRIGVGPRYLPTLEICDGSGQVGRLAPVALWIIGANGRVDVESPKGSHVVVDTAAAFAPPRWEMSALANQRKIERVTKASFRRLFVP